MKVNNILVNEKITDLKNEVLERLTLNFILEKFLEQEKKMEQSQKDSIASLVDIIASVKKSTEYLASHMEKVIASEDE